MAGGEEAGDGTPQRPGELGDGEVAEHRTGGGVASLAGDEQQLAGAALDGRREEAGQGRAGLGGGHAVQVEDLRGAERDPAELDELSPGDPGSPAADLVAVGLDPELG